MRMYIPTALMALVLLTSTAHGQANQVCIETFADSACTNSTDPKECHGKAVCWNTNWGSLGYLDQVCNATHIDYRLYEDASCTKRGTIRGEAIPYGVCVPNPIAPAVGYFIAYSCDGYAGPASPTPIPSPSTPVPSAAGNVHMPSGVVFALAVVSALFGAL